MTCSPIAKAKPRQTMATTSFLNIRQHGSMGPCPSENKLEPHDGLQGHQHLSWAHLPLSWLTCMQQPMNRQASTRQPQDTLIYVNNRNTVGPSVYQAGRSSKDVDPSAFHNALTGTERRPLNGGLKSIVLFPLEGS